ncbi:MAG TPA: sarcosine oxidase subunit gamma family protein [Steroidobacteraceae bacterium]|nr:sarcosine oxidase subunit gamma family protein [Steroidobacteraceae bacterium]
MSAPRLETCSAFAKLPFSSAPGRGVIALDRPAVALASVLTRKAQSAGLRRRVFEAFGLELPEGPRYIAARRVAFVGTGIGAWLALAEADDPEFSTALGRALRPAAAVADQSGAYAILRLSGPQVRSTLAKLLPLDLHPRVFEVGMAAATVAAHISIHLWRLADGPQTLPVFELAVPRSLSVSFWHALSESAAEFGFALSPG